MRKYEVELWSRLGVLVADISPYVTNFSFSMQRNEAENLMIEINLNAFEQLMEDIGTFPTSGLSPYATDVKIKRNGEYLFGTHVGEVVTKITPNDQVIQIRCFGYLNLLIDRYVTKNYTQEFETDICWDLIDTTQSQTNGDMGITLGGNQVQLVQRDRSYERQNVKEAIVNLTKLVTGNFDFEFTHDKQFNTYEMIGSDLSASVQFVYPDNIVAVNVPRNGLALFNKIYGLGSGFGDETLTSTQGDNDSQLNYGVHERIITWNSVIEQPTLEQNTGGQLDRRKDLLEIPEMTVNGTDFDLNSYGIGDRVTVRIEGHKFLQTVNGVYRIERLEVEVDENEAEDIHVFFDNYGLDQEDYE